MACIRIVSHRTCGDFLSARVIVHTPIAPEMEQEGQASSSRIHLLYRYVCKFQHDGSNAGKIPKMLCKMMQEQGYKKQPKYYGTQVTYEDSESVWHVQVYIFIPKPLRGVFEVKKIHAAIILRHNFYAGIHDAARQAYMVTHSHHRQLLNGMKYSHFFQWASGSTYINVEPVTVSRNFKVKEQVELTTAFTKELDSTTEEVEFWQEKYEEVMKIMLKLKRHCPQGMETLSRGRDRRVHSHFTTSQDGDLCTSSLRHSQKWRWLGVVALC
jgi:hypothetical protein